MAKLRLKGSAGIPCLASEADMEKNVIAKWSTIGLPGGAEACFAVNSVERKLTSEGW